MFVASYLRIIFRKYLVLRGKMRYTKRKQRVFPAPNERRMDRMNQPLAQRLRPKTLADVCGQQHLLAPGRVFRRTIESGHIPNMIFLSLIHI